jgi:hypothetical protein
MYNSNRLAVGHFESTFNLSETIVVPSIGNWDSYPADLLTPERSHIIRNLYDIWLPLFRDAPPEDHIAETFLLPASGGFYQRTVAPSVLCLSLSDRTLSF